MKTTAFFLLIPVVFYFSLTFAQEQTIKLNLEEGKTYVFKSKTTTTEFDNLETPTITSVNKAKFEYTIEEINSDYVFFSSIILSAISEEPDASIKTIHDIKFPPVVENTNHFDSPFQILNSLLTVIRPRYELNLTNNAIKQVNTAEILEKIYSIMDNKGYEKNKIEQVIELITKRNAIAQNMLSHTDLLLYFNDALKKEDGTIISNFLDKEFIKTNDGKFKNGQNIKLSGTEYTEVKLNENIGLVSHYYNVKYDSIKSNWKRNNRLRQTENEFWLDEIFKNENDFFLFDCTIQNPVDSFVTLYYMDKPFGEEYSRKLLKIDKNNRVSCKLKLPAQSFVFFANKKLDEFIRYTSFIFYTEPRDTLKLKFLDNRKSQWLEISGKNKIINNIIWAIQKKDQLFTPTSYIMLADYEEFRNVQNAPVIFDKYLKDNSIKLKEDVYRFVKNELIAREYSCYYSFLNQYNRHLQTPDRYIKTNKAAQTQRLIFDEAKKKIDSFDIHDVFNDFGIYSRRLSEYYLNYYLDNLMRVKSDGYNNYLRIVQDFNVAKMIFGGSIYYRAMADRIYNYILRNRLPITQAAEYELEEALILFNNLISQSYDLDYNNTLKKLRDQRLKWENENYIPDVEFYQPNGTKIKLEDVFKNKPTVLFIGNDWGAFRYGFDDEAKNNPEIRFVMIVQGRDLKEWQDYLERAAPVADQLLLIPNDNLTLNDIFLRWYKLYITYDKNGKLLGYNIEEKTAIKLAKQSLTEKKELDKSQLQILIIILSIILFTLIAGILFWKWRVRQRFRKEEHLRRLRELELTAIRSQMNPHFLFNCLNSVQNLVQQNKGREAHLYLSDFAGLIRKVLQNSEKEEVSLAEELEMTKQYLNLEKLRFDFDYTLSVDKNIDTNNTMIPAMLLQPFAENAIVHGLQNKPQDRKLKIEVFSEAKRFADTDSKNGSENGIVIIIEDNGIGRNAAAEISKQKNGKGSGLIKERLEILRQKRGEKYHLTITDLIGDKTGTRLEIIVPEEV